MAESKAPLALAGCRSRPLISYLKALGVFRVVARQADPDARAAWGSGVLQLSTSLDRERLERFLLERYAPTPVVSPWNGGSGFFPKDNKRARDAVLASEDPRLDALRAAYEDAAKVLAREGLDDKPSDRPTKLRVIRAMRGALADEALDWLDAAVVLTGPDPAYPPLLGSGGNDGRFDFSNNYGQAVVAAVLGVGGDPASLLRAALWGSQATLRKLSAGHFLRDASPVSSPAGEADALGNPWDVVLSVEGSVMLAAGAARRHGAQSASALVAPFTAAATAAGYGSAVDHEKGRAELWLPLWNAPATLSEIEALVREGRAQVGRRPARSGLDFARAAGELGVARGITAFERYTILERAGQASLAVPAGQVAVRERPESVALRSIDRWLIRTLGVRSRLARAPAAAITRLERAAFALAQRGGPAAAGQVVERLGEVEAILARSGAAEQGLTPLDRVQAAPWVQAGDDGSPEFAVALGVASLHDAGRSEPGVREYLHGTGRDQRGRPSYADRTPGAVHRRLGAVRRLAELNARRDLDADPAAEARSAAFDYGAPCPLSALRLFVAGALDEERIVRLAGGLALFEHRGPHPRSSALAAVPAPPAPVYELLALGWWGNAHTKLAPRPGWARRLANGAVGDVVADATLRLREAGLTPLLDRRDLLTTGTAGPSLAAALLVHLGPGDRAAIARRLCFPPETIEGDAA